MNADTISPADQITADTLRAGTAVIMAIADSIRELGDIPSGVLYSAVSGHLSIREFQSVIGLLERAGLVRLDLHVVRWIGGPES